MDVLTGALVHQLMFRRKITQTRMAAEMLISQSGLSKKLHGKVAWSLTDLAYAAAVLDVDIVDLIPREMRRAAESPRPVRDEGLGLPRQDLNLRPSDYPSCEVIVGPWAGAA